MNKITEALADLKVLLLEGVAPADAVSEIAEEYDITELALTNRAKIAFGELETFLERKSEEKKLLAGQEAEAQRKLALAKVKERIYAHNAVMGNPNHKDFLPEDKLIDMIELANSLGGKFTLTSHRRRAPRRPRDDFDFIIRELSKLLNVDLRKI